MLLRYPNIRYVVLHQDAVKDAPPVGYGGEMVEVLARRITAVLLPEPQIS